ncbi:imelysin family protein [Hansschlegelia beijingensis]|uniref:Putative iron-regulated protein n=1 Tax=Hansschlegelia beijingensis TaxID=1133344 RepID=A0A7W6CZA6_9HYPH|nr:imelysin family protein [Hansschlegelia beijingensis]MBB3973806.1 putative iron-regulated protein [Hansschlegelia beijingensis]
MTSRWIAALAGAGLSALAMTAAFADAPAPKDVVKTYADIALAMYGDSVTTAKALDAKVDAFLANPTDETLAEARKAWIAARAPYQQTEGYRFGNKAVDDLEGAVNAWPLDEGLIDYVDASYGETSDENPYYRLNVIANPKFKIGRKTVDASRIDKKLLASLNEAGEVESNVAAGYHAIEFLLWGQDLNGTGPGAGNRPATDYVQGAGCTHDNCDRRAAYLKAASDLLVDDLTAMEKLWGPKGKARAALMKKKGAAALAPIFTGLGSLSYGELAGERMKLGLILHDPEEEHDCFSDNTHNSHFYDILGMTEIWRGKYTRLDGTVVEGPSPKAYAEAKAPEEAKKLDALFDETLARAQAMKDKGDGGMAYDQMIGEGNAEGNKLVQEVIDALVAQTRGIEAVVAKLGVKITVEGSDSLDSPEKVTQ